MDEYLADPQMRKSSLGMNTLKRNREENYWWSCLWRIANYTSKCKQNLEYKWQAGEHIYNKPDRERTNTIPYEKQAKNVNTHFKKRRNG